MSRHSVAWKTMAAALAVLLALCGCAEKVRHPEAAAFERFLGGQKLEIGERTIEMKAENISEFRLGEIVLGPDARSATAAVSFSYSAPPHAYQVEGVVSYDVTPQAELKQPYFEANEVERVF